MSDASHPIDYRLSDKDRHVHHVWDNSLDPVLTVEPGDVVRFECRDGNDGEIDLDTTTDDIPDVRLDVVHPLTGPVAIDGASPGDVLQVDILEVTHKGWGWTAFWPGEAELGLLPDEFEEPGLHIWDLDEDVGYFVDGIEVPLNPFPGNIGVAPAEDGEHDTIPPRSCGGNMDIKHLTEDATLYLPVEVEGGLFSVGDGHAAQGDGEVCLTGIETSMFITVRFGLRSDMDIRQPQLETNGPFTATGFDEPMYATTGISDDLRDAAKKAVRHMIEHLHERRELTRTEAYILCSATVDLKINEIVDKPNWVVSAYIPESIFESG